MGKSFRHQVPFPSPKPKERKNKGTARSAIDHIKEETAIYQLEKTRATAETKNTVKKFNWWGK